MSSVMGESCSGGAQDWLSVSPALPGGCGSGGAEILAAQGEQVEQHVGGGVVPGSFPGATWSAGEPAPQQI